MTSTLSDHSSRGRNSLLAWWISLCAGLLFFYEFIQLNAMNSLSESLSQQFHLSATHLGDLSAMYFIANAGLVFVAGNILDRFSPRRITLAATLLCTVATVGFALSKSVISLEAFRFLVGVGGAFCFLCGMRIASRWFTPDKLGAVTGVLVTMAMFGGMLAQTPLTWLIERNGWRGALLIDAGLGMAIFVLMFFVLHDSPEHRIVRPHQRAQQALIPHIKRALSNRQNWLAATYSSCLNLPIFILGALWGGAYLQHVNGLTPEQATNVCSMLFAGTIVGSPLMGALSDRIKRRKAPMLVGAALSLIVMMILIQIHGPHMMTLLLVFFLLGLISSTQVISYALVNESNREDITATAVSLISTLILLGGAIFQPWFGQIMDHLQQQHSLAFAYRHALWLLPIMMLIGGLCSLGLRETFAKRQSL